MLKSRLFVLLLATSAFPLSSQSAWENITLPSQSICDALMTPYSNPAEQARWQKIPAYQRGLVRAWQPLLGTHKVRIEFGNVVSLPPIEGRILDFRLSNGKKPSVQVVVEAWGVNQVGKARVAQQTFPLEFVRDVVIISAPENVMSVEAGTAAEIELADYYRRIEDDLVSRSALLQTSIKAKSRTAQGRHKTTIGIVGAGPHGSIALANFRVAYPEASNVIYSETLGTFNTLSTFQINTVETMEDSGNTFPNAPVQVRDINPMRIRFNDAKKLGWVGLSTLRFADANVVLGQTVESIKFGGNDASGLKTFTMTTASGLKSQHNVIFAATGLGKVEVRFEESESQNFVTAQLKAVDEWIAKGMPANFSPSVVTVDQLHIIAKMDELRGRDAIQRWSGYAVGMIGAGDGGNIGVQKLPKDATIYWLSQKSKTADEFLAQYEDLPLKRERYYPVSNYYARRQVTAIPYYLYSVTPAGSQNGKALVDLGISTNKQASGLMAEKTSVNLVVLANGYRNRVADMFKGLSGGDSSRVTLLPVLGHTDQFSKYEDASAEVLGQQVHVDGEALPIFVVGNAANIPVSDMTEEVSTGGFLDILLAKTAALAYQVGDEFEGLVKQSAKARGARAASKPKPPSRGVPELVALPKSSVRTNHLLSEKANAGEIALTSRRNAEIEMRTLIAKTLAFQLGLREGQRTTFSLAINRSNLQFGILSQTGFSAEQANLLKHELESNPAHVNALRILIRHGIRLIQVECGCRNNRTAKIEDMILKFEYDRDAGPRI